MTDHVGCGSPNVVDSSGWIGYSADGPNNHFLETAIQDAASLAVPRISLYEVSKRLLWKLDGESLGLRWLIPVARCGGSGLGSARCGDK